MQDAAFLGVKQQQFPEQEQRLKCPRCESTNTKFCYYNNYNLSQPRHFCKSCRRYWTKGGTLRNVPVGGGTRKGSKRPADAAAGASKRPSSSDTTASSAAEGAKAELAAQIYPGGGMEGSSRELLTRDGFGEFGFHTGGTGSGGMAGGGGDGVDSAAAGGDLNGWMGLSMYAPRSSFE